MNKGIFFIIGIIFIQLCSYRIIYAQAGITLSGKIYSDIDKGVNGNNDAILKNYNDNK